MAFEPFGEIEFDYRETPSFVGRQKELALLEEHFRRQPPQMAVIAGLRGAGKTALVYMFRRAAKRLGLFPGGDRTVSATYRPVGSSLFDGVSVDTRPELRSLLVVDDYQYGSAILNAEIRDHIARYPNQSVIICTDSDVDKTRREFPASLVIELGGLDQAEFFHLLQTRVASSRMDKDVVDSLYRLVAGNPAFADIAGRTIREHLFTLNEFVHGLHPFEQPGILGPDGKPLRDLPTASRLVVVDTNQMLFEYVRDHPEELHGLDPRKFEELVAHMLKEQGYDVTLTPPSKDGGFDMFAARKDGLGSFLFLVECKRYTPPQKVGVSVVRALHGVVQQGQANGGIVITSSFFTKGAEDFQQKVPYQLQLKDYLALQKWFGRI